MDNKYIKRFFLLTEQNILSSQFAVGDGNNSSAGGNILAKMKGAKDYLFWATLLLVMVVAFIFINVNYQKKVAVSVDVLPNIMEPQAVVKNNLSIESSIPGFRVSSKIQMLDDISLKKFNLAFLNEHEDTETSQMLLLDKVLVVPKFFG